jgi:hypothetical protein
MSTTARPALVRALTGMDTDRLPEEQRRGLTIEPGFAYVDFGSDELSVAFVDVPGHERFVRNMLAGVSRGRRWCCWWWPPTTARCRRRANTWRCSICSAPSARWWS